MIATREFDSGATDDKDGDDDEIEATLREVRTFMDDPVALLERAVMLMKRQGSLIAFGVAIGDVLT